MITTLEQYSEERYRALEVSFLEELGIRMGREFREIRSRCVEDWKRILSGACAVQEQENIPCAYMSISLLNTSLLEGKPLFQVDFYNGDWVYGEPWERGRMSAEFLFRDWEAFQRSALNDAFYVRSVLQRTAIKSLFWGTVEKTAYLFACFAKYFMEDLAALREFRALKKEDSMYVTCGTYLDWQERLYAILPEIDLTDVPENEETAFRSFDGKVYHEKIFRELDLRHARFKDCIFRRCVFQKINLSDAVFRNCKFYDTDFIEARFPGSTWENCTLTECRFQGSGTQIEGEEYFGEAEMRRSRLHDIQAVNCDFSYFLLRDCNAADVSLVDVKLEHSDWEKARVERHG